MLLLLALLPVSAGFAAAHPEGYHTFAEVESALEQWARAHSEITDLASIGRSAGDRDLWLLRIAGPGAVAPDERPAVFVGANVAGYHNAGTEAALDLIETLLGASDEATVELLGTRTFYVAPALHPDAHDAMFAAVRTRRLGNGARLDQDRDGLVGEDDVDDLDGDGRITAMRIADPTGGWLPHPDEPRVMVKADATKDRIGAYRLIDLEGDDGDGDGDYNEDPTTGIVVDRNFPHAFPFPDPDAGPFATYAPESKALVSYLWQRRNIVAAVVYGPANNLLDMPRSLGGGGDLGTQTFKLPPQAAEFLGFDPEVEYTIDEVWEEAKDQPFVRQNNITKDQLAQFLGAGPATKVEDDDVAVLQRLAKDYETRLEDAALDHERPARQYGKGGLTPWLYYQFGTLAIELDVWGIPKPAKEADEAEGETPKLTVDSLASMSADDFVALGEEAIQAFLDEIGAPPSLNATMVIGRVEGGQITPEQMAAMVRQMPGAGGGGNGGGDGDDDPAVQRERDVIAWLEENVPDAIRPWTPVTLADGTHAEVGGIDPFAALAPPRAVLEPALGVHTATVLDLASRLARVALVAVDVEPLGAGVYRVDAVARNDGELASHTQMAVRANARLPVRLSIDTDDRVSLVTGYPGVSAPKLDGRTGTLEGRWLVRATPGAKITVRLTSQTAGNDSRTITVPKGASR